ncbi:hypothetical protein [Mesorhizobium sp. WSM2239]|uniref:LXG domain-containing protein n=2 Tax=unclassified Mesorhizobium TaxID=325217 RepID=A0AAU8D2V7_9HYPH
MHENDEELRWRLEVLKAQLESGKIYIADHLVDDLKKSLGAVRYSLDGRIDLATVDSRVRSMSLVTAFMHQRDKAKAAISLIDISRMYFEFVEKNLGFLAKQASENSLDAAEFASAIISIPAAVDELSTNASKFLEALGEFWDSVADSSHYHLQDLMASKAIFGGDLFPSYTQNIASSVGLYIDTIILGDPFWNSKHVFDHGSAKQKAFYLAKHAINVLQYRDLATEDFPKPIVVFSPFRSSIDDDEKSFLQRIATEDGLKHASALYGRQFKTIEELKEFSALLDTPEKVMSTLVDPSRLLFDTEWTEPLQAQIRRALNGEWGELTNDPHAGRMIAGQCFGRMGQATDLLLKSRYLSGVPLIDAPTSWQYFNWKLEYNSALTPEHQAHLHMVKGLQHVAQSDEQWLGKIPPEALIEMRKEGAFEEIRNVLGSGVEELAIANPTGFFRTSDKIVDNIRNAFADHMKEVSNLRKKKIKFAGYDVGSMLIAGGIDITSIIAGTPTFGAASFAVNQLVDAPKLRDIPERYRTLKNAHNELRKSPMGMFFRHRK